MICRYKIKFISDIEQKIRKLLVNIAVAPFVGVWIEILIVNKLSLFVCIIFMINNLLNNNITFFFK